MRDKIKFMENGQTEKTNEINYWNGKCATMKRDLEYNERFMQKFKEDSDHAQKELHFVQAQMQVKEKECDLLKQQINGLNEDNDRINRMYQVVEREAFNQKSYVSVPASKPVSAAPAKGGKPTW